MKKAGIIGFGLIGGSIALALKNRCNMDIVASSRSEAPLKQAYADGVLSDYSVNDLTIFKDCDIIFVCTPVSKIAEYVKKLIPIIKKDCIITDAGSTKGEIFKALSSYNINYIGAHPMAGSEKTGYSAAKDSLYENAFYVLTPSSATPKELVESYKELVKKIGAIPIVIDPSKHDHVVAAISHVPHLIAASLVNMVHSLDDEEEHMHTLAAGGFKDITRIASSNAEMWSSICAENKNEILSVMDSFIDNFKKFKNAINSDDYNRVAEMFKSSKQYRDSFDSLKGRGACKSYTLRVDIFDRPGAIAEVAAILALNGINIKNIGIMNNREYTDGVLEIRLESDSHIKAAAALLSNRGFGVIL